MKSTNCNFCNQDNYVVVNQGPDLLLGKPGDYRLVQCKTCGLIYQNPQLTIDEFPQHYPKTYQPYYSNLNEIESISKRLSMQYYFERRCRLAMKFQPKIGTLLDIGCSTGLFLHKMRQNDWQVEGIEPSVYAAEYARNKFQLNVHTGTLNDVQLASNFYSLVTMWDVLEHVLDPKETLFEVARLLKSNGILLLSLPNPRSFEANLFGSAWAGWDRPRHTHIFSPAMIKNYLQMALLDVVDIVSKEGRLGLTLLSVEMWCKQNKLPEKYWKPLIKFGYNLPLRLLTLPFYKIGELFNISTNMIVVARKRG